MNCLAKLAENSHFRAIFKRSFVFVACDHIPVKLEDAISTLQFGLFFHSLAADLYWFVFIKRTATFGAIFTFKKVLHETDGVKNMYLFRQLSASFEKELLHAFFKGIHYKNYYWRGKNDLLLLGMNNLEHNH